MRSAFLIAACGAAALITGCAESIQVQTMASPDIRFADLTTFRVMPAPRPRGMRAETSAYDPMVNNSITNRALRETITHELLGRGYALNELVPDFAVAVYASAHEKLDATAWDYGYPYYPRWNAPDRVRPIGEEYTEGTVVVDVVRTTTHELLWRGSGTARLSDNPKHDVKALQQVAAAIVRKLPRVVPRAVAER